MTFGVRQIDFSFFFFKLPDPMISEAREKMMKHASVVVVIRDDESRFLFLDFRMCDIFWKYRFIDQF